MSLAASPLPISPELFTINMGVFRRHQLSTYVFIFKCCVCSSYYIIHSHTGSHNPTRPIDWSTELRRIRRRKLRNGLPNFPGLQVRHYCAQRTTNHLITTYFHPKHRNTGRTDSMNKERPKKGKD